MCEICDEVLKNKSALRDLLLTVLDDTIFMINKAVTKIQHDI